MKKIFRKLRILCAIIIGKNLSEEEGLKRKLLSGKASSEEALKLYQLYIDAGKNFPLELEDRTLTLLIKEDPDRMDLVARQGQVKQLLNLNNNSSEEYIDFQESESAKNTNKIIRVNKPVFIIGCGRSGTTMLFRILSTSQELEPTTGFPDGEDHIAWLKYTGAVISGIGHESCDGGIVGFNACMHMDGHYVTDEAINKLHQYYYYEVLKENKSKRVINKCPHLSNKIDFVRTIFPDAKFIHIVRDCLPVVASWVQIMKSVPELALYWPGTEYGCLWTLRLPKYDMVKECLKDCDQFYPGAGPEFFVDYWNAVNSHIKKQFRGNADQLMTVRYEDLCQNPDEWLPKICNFAEIDDSNYESFKNIPIQKDTNQKYNVVLDDNEQRKCLEKAADVRKLFGYL